MMQDNYDPDKLQNLAKEDLIALLMQATEFGHFLLKAYHMKRSYNVDFMALPEWKNTAPLLEARRLKPQWAAMGIVQWFTKLNNALDAAVRRSQFHKV